MIFYIEFICVIKMEKLNDILIAENSYLNRMNSRRAKELSIVTKERDELKRINREQRLALREIEIEQAETHRSRLNVLTNICYEEISSEWNKLMPELEKGNILYFYQSKEEIIIYRTTLDKYHFKLISSSGTMIEIEDASTLSKMIETVRNRSQLRLTLKQQYNVLELLTKKLSE